MASAVTVDSSSICDTSALGKVLASSTSSSVSTSSLSCESTTLTVIGRSHSLGGNASKSVTASGVLNNCQDQIVGLLNVDSCAVLPETKLTETAAELLLNGIVGNCRANVVNQHQSILAEDSRTLQLALELSMVGLGNSLVSPESSSVTAVSTSPEAMAKSSTMHNLQSLQQHLQQSHQSHHHHQQQQHLQHHQQHQHQSFDLNEMSAAVAAAADSHANQQQCGGGGGAGGGGIMPPVPVEERLKKSQNMTECVPVPSSEHVAEIVGRQGCKIKALRAKTNTYIKTPVRGEEPVFVVTGRKEDVAKAKREILSAADHFSLIRATRKPSLDSNISGGSNNVSIAGEGKSPHGPPVVSGQVTIQVRVPYRVVGLVVGPKGATIKHIQQETQTYIVTPSREKEPIFEVTGLPDNVQTARRQIEAHIALRTGNMSNGNANATPNTADSISASTTHTINSLSQILNNDINPDLLAALYKNGICSTFDYVDNNDGSVCETTVASASIVSKSINNGMNINLSNGECGGIANELFDSITANCNSYQFPKNDYNLGGGIMGHCNLMEINDEINVQQPQQQLHHQQRPQHHDNIVNFSSSQFNTPINAMNLLPLATANNNSGCSAVISHGTNMNNRSCSSASSTTSSKSAHNGGNCSSTNSSRPELINIWKNLGESLDIDEGIGESPSIWTLSTPAVQPVTVIRNGPHSSSTASVSPTDSLLADNGNAMQSDGGTIGGGGVNNLIGHHNMAMQFANGEISRRECLICNDMEVTAALVPCGHNMFCMDCANRICTSDNGVCPICGANVYHAMRILA